jgi:hypothetical protein
MDHAGCAANQVTVARYDDDYPLLYGEPAPQPQRKPGTQVRPLAPGSRPGERFAPHAGAVVPGVRALQGMTLTSA